MTPRNPHYIIEINGRRLDSWKDKQIIKHVQVELATNKASEAQVALFDARFKVLDSFTSGDGVPQLPMFVWMGFGWDLGPPVFKGLLVRVHRDSTTTHFIAYDMGYKMRRERRGEYHNNMDDIEINRKLAARNGLSFEGPDGEVKLDKHKAIIQDSKNDWEFMSERNRESGFVHYVRDDTLYVKEPAKIKAPLITLVYRRDFVLLHELDMTYKLPENRQGKPLEVEWRGRRKGGRRLVGVSPKHPRGTRPMQITEDLAIHSKSYANRRATAAKELQREHAFTCTIRSVPPLPGVRPDVRDTIALANAGKLFSGPYLCDQVRHEGDAGGFRTEYSLYRDIKG